MTTIDPSTALGKVRLRIGDWSDVVILPDSVILGALSDNNGSLSKAAKLCAQYVLGTLTAKSHKKLAVMELWSGEEFTNYVQFLKLTVLNPHLADIAPIPYNGIPAGTLHPLQEFMEEWKTGYVPGTVVLPPGSFGTVGTTGLQPPGTIIVNDNPS